MVYVPINLKLANHHVQSLLSGGSVRITSNMIGSGEPCLVNKTQLKRMAKVHGGGAGFMTLKMSKAHLKHNIKHGSGLWQDFKDMFKKGVKRVGPHIINYLGAEAKKAGAPSQLVNYAGNYAKSKINGLGLFSSIGDFVTHTIPDQLSKPSNILGIASMLPTPLATPLKVASFGAKMLGQGVNKKRKGGKIKKLSLKRGKGFFSDIASSFGGKLKKKSGGSFIPSGY
jgi:hypothetical protein